ncbi:hypothetical protein D3C81_783640 [compost metagenome]
MNVVIRSTPAANSLLPYAEVPELSESSSSESSSSANSDSIDSGNLPVWLQFIDAPIKAILNI